MKTTSKSSSRRDQGCGQIRPSAVRNIRQALRDRGSSLNAWAKDRGYPVRTVYSCVETWAGRTDRAPHGGVSRSIMADLRAELGSDLVPEVRR